MGPVLSSANADLRRPAEKVVATSANARAATTLTSYSSQLRMFWLWADEHQISRSYPVAVPIVTAYLQHRTETAGCANTVRQSQWALRYAHVTLGLPDPTAHRLAQSVVAVADKTLSNNVNRKAPVTPHMIMALLHKRTETNLPLIKRVIVTAAVFAFLRSRE